MRAGGRRTFWGQTEFALLHVVEVGRGANARNAVIRIIREVRLDVLTNTAAVIASAVILHSGLHNLRPEKQEKKSG